MYRPGELPVKEFLREDHPIPPIYRQKSKPKPPRCDQVKYFCRTTAVHGFGHVVDPDELFFLRIFWGLVVATFSGVIVLFLYWSIVSLLSRSLTTEFIEVTDSVIGTDVGILLPDIHICDASIFNATRLADMGFNATLATYLTLATSHGAAQETLIQNDKNHGEVLKNEFEAIMTKNSWTMRDVLEKAAPKCVDIVLACSTNGEFFTKDACCSKYFGLTSYVSSFGSCISTYGKRLGQFYDSRYTGFIVYIIPNVLHVINFDTRIIKPEFVIQRGLYYAVSSPAKSIEAVLNTHGQFAAPNSWVSVPITKSVDDNSEMKNNFLAPETCVDTNDTDYIKRKTPNYDYYSKANCILSTYQEGFKALNGNCSALFYKHGPLDKLCSPVDLAGALNTLYERLSEFDCPIECISKNYEASPSNAAFDAQFLADMYGLNLTVDKPVGLHFFFSTVKYELRIKHPTTLLKWLGEVGGNMGIFLGASLVSVLEILALCLRCCCCLIKRRSSVNYAES